MFLPIRTLGHETVGWGGRSILICLLRKALQLLHFVPRRRCSGTMLLQTPQLMLVQLASDQARTMARPFLILVLLEAAPVVVAAPALVQMDLVGLVALLHSRHRTTIPGTRLQTQLG